MSQAWVLTFPSPEQLNGSWLPPLLPGRGWTARLHRHCPMAQTPTAAQFTPGSDARVCVGERACVRACVCDE